MSIGITYEGKTVLSKGYGYRDYEAKTDIDGDTITGGLFVSDVFGGKTYEVSGHFTIQNCD